MATVPPPPPAPNGRRRRPPVDARHSGGTRRSAPTGSRPSFNARRTADAPGLPAARQGVVEDTPVTMGDLYRVFESKLSMGLVEHQIDSYEHMLLRHIPECFEMKPVEVVHEGLVYTVCITAVRFEPPTVTEADGRLRRVYPHECVLRRMAYNTRLIVTARYTIAEEATGHVRHDVVFRDKVFDEIPCMVGSRFCSTRARPQDSRLASTDCGGYFIVGGVEKAVLGQEQPRLNYCFVGKRDGGLQAEIRSNPQRHRSTSTLYISAHPPFATDDPVERRCTAPRVRVTIPFVHGDLALQAVFKLLGVRDQTAMANYIVCPGDPPWFRQRVHDVLLHDLDAALMTVEDIVARVAHDRGGRRDRRHGQPPPPEVAAAQAAVNAAQKALSNAPRDDASAQARLAQAQMALVQARADADVANTQRQVAGLLRSEFLPHQGTQDEDLPAKAVLLGYYVRRLLGVYFSLGEMAGDSRDHYMNRRQQLVGNTMPLIFRNHLSEWRRRVASQMRRSLAEKDTFINVEVMLKGGIGGHLESALKSGVFSIKGDVKSSMDGVSQTLSRIEPHSDVAHVRRCDTPMPRDGGAIEPRMAHQSLGGATCPSETPEGSGCGLLRNLAILSGVRVGHDTSDLIRVVLLTGMVDTKGMTVPLGKLTRIPVFVNGRLIGQTARNQDARLITALRSLRAAQDLPSDISIYQTCGAAAITPQGAIHINGDTGSYYWPLLVVKRLHLLREVLDTYTHEDGMWRVLLARGIVELINKDEEVFCTRVALSLRELRSSPPNTFTHVVIHPSQVLSLTTARIPLAEFNAAPRVTYAASMIKQALGEMPTNAPYRFYPADYSMWYPQRALVSTMANNYLRRGPDSGQMMIVGVGHLNTGDNIEDSVILKRGAIDRGLFRTMVKRSFYTEVKTSGDEKEHLGLPPEGCRGLLNMSYEHINPATGVIEPGTLLNEDSVAVSKYVELKTRHKEYDPVARSMVATVSHTLRDRSTPVRVREPMRVDEVVSTTTLDGSPLVRVRTSTMRTLHEGDKVACLTPEHDVLTRRGWVPIAEVTQTDIVLSTNGRHVVWADVEATHAYAVEDQPMMAINLAVSKDAGAIVTHNHRLPRMRGETMCLLQADDNEGVALPHLACAKEGLLMRNLPWAVSMALEAWQGDAAHFFWMVGFLNHFTVPLGPITFGTPLRLEVLTFRFQDIVALVSSTVDEDFSFTRIGGNGGGRSRVILTLASDDCPLFQLLINLKLAYGDAGVLQTGIPPQWAIGLSQPNARAYLRGFAGLGLEGVDSGVVVPDDLDWCQVRDTLQAIGLSAGVVVEGRRDCGDLRILFIASRTQDLQVDASLTFTGTVHCLTVPGTETFCVRRRCLGGLPLWTGNSRFGQKGVVGRVVADVDMPFDPKSGMSPDLIINTHGLPSRMTVGHLLEVLMGHLAVAEGEIQDGTPFTLSDSYADGGTDPTAVVRDAQERLTALGLRNDGKVRMLDGITAQPLQYEVFMGPQFYMCLRHMVLDKKHKRSIGRRNPQTNQPVEGRMRDGGTRFGEMERDCLLTHGSMGLLYDRLVHCSDGTPVHVCHKCGHIAQPPKPRDAGGDLYNATVHAGHSFCHVCMTGDHVQSHTMPHAFQLTIAQCAALNIDLQLLPKEEEG